MNTEERGARIDQFMVGARWMMGILAALAILSVLITIGTLTDSRKQTIDAIIETRKQVEILRDQNHWSIQDRADLHRTQGQIFEALKRIEGRK